CDEREVAGAELPERLISTVFKFERLHSPAERLGRDDNQIRIVANFFLDELQVPSSTVRDTRDPKSRIQIKAEHSGTIRQDVDGRERLRVQVGSLDGGIDFLMLNIHQAMVFIGDRRCPGIVVGSKMKRVPDAEIAVTKAGKHHL